MLLRRFGDWFSSRGVAVERAVESVGWVYACNAKLSETSALVRLSYFHKGTGEPVDVLPDPMSVVQDYLTGEYLDHGDILSRIVSNLGYFGRCAMLIEKSSKGDLDRPSLVRLVPGHVLKFDTNERVWTVGGSPVDFRKLIIWRNYHPVYADVGVPPYFFAKLSLEELYYIHRWNKNFFRSGMRPDVVIRVPQRLTPKQRKEMRDELLEEFAGVDKGNSFFIISGIREGEVQLSGRTEKDIDFREGKEFTREEICSVYGVPPALVGIFRYANYANSSAQMHIFWFTSVLPKIHRILGVLQRRYLDRYWPNIEVRPDTSQASIMLIGVDEMSNAVAKLVQAGYTYDEVSRILNYPSLAVGRSAFVSGPSAAPESPGSGSGPVASETELESESEQPEPVEESKAVHAKSSASFSLLAPTGSDGLLEVIYSKGYERDYAEFYQLILTDRSKALGRAIRSWAREVIEDVLESIRSHGFPEVSALVWSHAFQEAVGPLVELHYKDAVARVFDELDESRPKKSLARFGWTVKRPQLTSYLSADQLAVIDQDVQALMSKIKGLSATVVDRTLAIARQAVFDGLTVGEVRNLLMDKIGLADPDRATTWARDISGTIYNRGRFAGFQARGVTHHRWVNSRDQFVRDSHVREAQSAPVMLGQPFPVTTCRYPHDPQGPAKEVINCRCTTVAVYVRRREATPQDAPVRATPKPVSEEDEIIKIRERVLFRLKEHFPSSDGALLELKDLSDLSPNELKVLDDITARHEALMKDAIGAVPIRLERVGKKLGDKAVDIVLNPSKEKVELQKRVRGLLDGEDLREFDREDVQKAFPSMTGWIQTTRLGNLVNGRAIEYNQELIRRAPDLVRRKGIVFMASTRTAADFSTEELVEYYANFIQELSQFQQAAKGAAKVIEEQQGIMVQKVLSSTSTDPYTKMIKDRASLLPTGWEKDYVAFIRSTRPRRLDGVPGWGRPPTGDLEQGVENLNRLLKEGRKVSLDQGYSSAGPLWMTWEGDVHVYYMIPKKNLAGWLEKNGGLFKFGSHLSRTWGLKEKGLQIAFTSEEEVVFKGRFRLREAKMGKGKEGKAALIFEAEE